MKKRDTADDRDDNLDRMILAAAPHVAGDSEAPSDFDIFAYLSNQATEEQKQAVQSAMLRSAEFRRHMLSLSTAMSELESGAEVVGNPRGEPGTDDDSPGEGLWDRVLETVREWFSLRPAIGFAAGAAAVAVLVVGVFVTIERLSQPDPLVQVVVVGELQPEFFATTLSGDVSEISAAESMDAAVNAFKAQVSYVERSWLLVAVGQLKQESDRTVRLGVLDRDGNTVSVVEAALPVEAVDVEAWFLVPPGVEVSKASMDEDSMRYQRAADTGGFVVFTYRETDGFRATRVQEF